MLKYKSAPRRGNPAGFYCLHPARIISAASAKFSAFCREDRRARCLPHILHKEGMPVSARGRTGVRLLQANKGEGDRMIYLDNAAGSHPKPEQVKLAMAEALDRYGANPGRGNYQLTRQTSAMVDQTRQKLAAFVGAPAPERMIFTAGATMSLNLALRGLLRAGDHVIYSGMEHNAVYRPLAALEDGKTVSLTRIKPDAYGYITAGQVERALRPNTALIALSHASNVCGSVQPVAEIGIIARERRIPFLVDAAQSAGLLPLDVEGMHISLLALAGHKALYGPAGIGSLYVSPSVSLRPFLLGGTGGQSELRQQPSEYPAHLEAGSLNTAGIAAWGAALDFVQEIGVERLYAHSMALLERLIAALSRNKRLRLHLPPESRERAPLLSLIVRGMEATEAAACLDAEGICVRAGYHCAPLAHRALGSFDAGSLRFSPGWFNTEADIDAAAAALSRLPRR